MSLAVSLARVKDNDMDRIIIINIGSDMITTRRLFTYA
jgi:hypothetical protein